MSIRTAITVILYILLAPLAGGLLEGLDRKISARMQGRIGPPILQPFYDVRKLMNKQVIAVSVLQSSLLLCYLALMIFTGSIFFAGSDILMCLFMLTTASTFMYFSAVVTSSPYNTIASSRELIQIMTYEPAVLLAGVGFYLVAGTFSVARIANNDIVMLTRMPGLFVSFVLILLIAEWYETSILMGIVGLFAVTSNPLSYVGAVLLCAAVYFFLILADNACARVKWDQMMRVTWLFTLFVSGVNLLILMLVN